MELDEKIGISPPTAEKSPHVGETVGPLSEQLGRVQTEDSRHSRKRKRFDNDRLQHGSRARRKDLGRAEWSRQPQDKRARNEAEQNKRQKIENNAHQSSALPKTFAKDEIDAEERRPKRKVAVLVGYSGSGYKGMQISNTEKTIEGDLFTAFVAAGAISKANADDPKKSALVRCARTDKGVHAAGNVISLKLIMEDPDIVEKINANLSPQIRVWDIERTTGSFSCYQACDSRWYEYLIPTYAFLPPHPHSFLGKKLVELADEAGDHKDYDERQAEVASFWADGEQRYIKPILDSLDPEIRELCKKALYESDIDPEAPEDVGAEPSIEEAVDLDPPIKVMKCDWSTEDHQVKEKTEAAVTVLEVPPTEPITAKDEIHLSDAISADTTETHGNDFLETNRVPATTSEHAGATPVTDPTQKRNLDTSVKRLKAAYISLRKSYRIHPTRLSRIREALTHFLGTNNFHNYTIQKSPRDPSAKRNIKSFVVSDTSPLLIKGCNAENEQFETEWLSLRIHGQSFMMHQIRKMVGMLALCIRCDTPLSRIKESFAGERISIPKVPGLGLLLERPVFDSYNEGVADKFGKNRIDFGKFEKEMGEFKQREIYERIWREEERENVFCAFFAHVDGFKEDGFLWVSSKGLHAVTGGKEDAVGKRRAELGGKRMHGKEGKEGNSRKQGDIWLESEDERADGKETDGQGEG